MRSTRRARARLAASLTTAAIVAAWASASSSGAPLPDGRAWELVSPGAKFGNDIVAETSRTRAAAAEAPGLLMAVAYASLGGFADVQGTGISVEYLSERTGAPGTSGWSVHAITPRQEPMSFLGAALQLDPIYEGDMSADLSRGIFRAWSPLTAVPNVADVENLYTRTDLRTAGAGFYQLLTGGPFPVVPGAFPQRPYLAGASDDFEHAVFESRLSLTPDAVGGNVKLYKADHGVTRLIASGSACPGAFGFAATSPCSAAGLGAVALKQTARTISSDGSRVTFTSPVSFTGDVVTRAGVTSKLQQLNDGGTAAADDDVTLQINTSEKAVPDTAEAARFQTASADGSRIFFTSVEQLTDEPGSGLYMWERQATNEVQGVEVDATGGSFTLTSHSQPTVGSGELTSGSSTISSVAGSFSVGQTISGPGIPAGTTITAMGPFFDSTTATLDLSAPATATGPASLTASVQDTTAPLAHDATAQQVESALEALLTIRGSNVTVSGGAGSYELTFDGALAGVNVAQLTADGSGLIGGASTATVSTTHPLENLTLIGRDAFGTIGASEDGHRLYFIAVGQLVSGAPALRENGIYHWQDATGPPGGTLSFVGPISAGDTDSNVNVIAWNLNARVSRVTPDGRHLLFEVTDGNGLASNYDHGSCPTGNPNLVSNGLCSELYVYSADSSSPLSPDVVCASCNPSNAPATANALVNVRVGAGATQLSWHLNRALSADGRFVFFSTAEALVLEDANSTSDVYEYDVASRTVHLVTSGRDVSDSFFLDASADGRDVFFLTRERLVGWDTDQAYDLYDARIGGGVPEPPPPPKACAQDACQGTVPAPPGEANFGSSAFEGQGNASSGSGGKRAKACKRGFVKKRIRGRARCVKRRHGKRSRTRGRARSKSDRGAR